MLRAYLTEDNHVELATAATGLTKSGLRHLLAERFPQADVPSRITSRIEPLSPNRYRVQFTASEELSRQIQRAMDLMAHRNRTKDLDVVMQYMFDVGLAKLEKERLAKTTTRTTKTQSSSSEKTTRSTSSARVAPLPLTVPRADDPSAHKSEAANDEALPRKTRRETFERDGEQCTFVSKDGERCTETGGTRDRSRHATCAWWHE
jgi:hypothetical protein